MKMSQIDTEIDKKTQKFPTFKVKFYAFFVKVWQTSWIGMFWRVNNEKIGTSRSL